MTSDPRVPVLVSDDAPVPRGWAELRVAAGAHATFGCACCVPRGPWARALGALWLARVRDGAPLPGVVARGADAAGLKSALAADVVTAARFRAFADCSG